MFQGSSFISYEIFCWQDCIHIFSKGHNSGKGHNPVKKKKYVSAIFFMRNPYKKFQNSSMHGSTVILCIKKPDERTDERPRSNMPLQLLRSWNFFEVGGITTTWGNASMRIYWVLPVNEQGHPVSCKLFKSLGIMLGSQSSIYFQRMTNNFAK